MPFHQCMEERTGRSPIDSVDITHYQKCGDRITDVVEETGFRFLAGVRLSRGPFSVAAISPPANQVSESIRTLLEDPRGTPLELIST